MQSRPKFSFLSSGLALAALVSLFLAVPGLRAQAPARNNQQDSHIVSSAQLQQQVQDSAAVRQKNIDALNQFLSTPDAQQAMKTAKIDPVQVKTAVPTLSDAELANLSARAQHAQQEFAAGHLSNAVWLIIIIAIVVIIVVAVVH